MESSMEPLSEQFSSEPLVSEPLVSEPLLSSMNTLSLCPASEVPNDPGKMFIGGLSWLTTPESIRAYFSQFGELAEVMVMKDPTTRRSRGFGFITFVDSASVRRVLAHPAPHQLDGKSVEPKVAVPRKTNPRMSVRTRKIFVGGLSASTTVDHVKGYFEQFSPVQDAMLAFDKNTNRHRGFGFVTFDNDEVVDKICEIHFHEINGKMVESKKALPRDTRHYNYYGNNHNFGGGYHQQRFFNRRNHNNYNYHGNSDFYHGNNHNLGHHGLNERYFEEALQTFGGGQSGVGMDGNVNADISYNQGFENSHDFDKSDRNGDLYGGKDANELNRKEDECNFGKIGKDKECVSNGQNDNNKNKEDRNNNESNFSIDKNAVDGNSTSTSLEQGDFPPLVTKEEQMGGNEKTLNPDVVS